MPIIDLNADIGEGGQDDPVLIEFATSVNIACGGHAGNEGTMRMCIEASKAMGTAIGAHPGYEDPDNFGRLELDLSPDELSDQMRRQLERILSMHPELHHVKPHGALYHQANNDPAIAATVVLAIHELQPNTMLYCPPHGELAKTAAQAGLQVCPEGYIDRSYMSDGNLTPRTEANAIHEDFGQAVGQAMQIIMSQSLECIDGERIAMPARTLCVHGDNPDAPDLLEYARDFMQKAGVEIAAPSAEVGAGV